MWAVFRFMMYWYVSTSGVRAMFADWRFPESWTGPNFCVAPTGHDARQTSVTVAKVTPARRIETPLAVAAGSRSHSHAIQTPVQRAKDAERQLLDEGGQVRLGSCREPEEALRDPVADLPLP